MAGKMAGADQQDDLSVVFAADSLRVSDLWQFLVSDAASDPVLYDSCEKRIYQV